ncbi:UNVERIFIED_ORG: transcriptional repressor NrdR [Methylobacterium sp. SuP10 SLI 274]|uniref:NrdR family transcriptional regulator n=1 Tax=Methylorubrum extorquens TaxID=408 RepID=UPI00247C1AFE|nr:hypothetical protein [Methylorubrum extorquens]MDF9791432.1 transcriptional repressor NrdR [Methylorubrum extorquens]MDF9863128.1 transcriptional repressor NrdR [Methylorubrum pseudosasae]MDH6636740.1 transcriptional repressor NrdR [Methylobacterium sp. SuP10 SLI 274]MDH6665917.1 transcriptional repressor NrdR [Methylorubrum zatmanii]
MICARCDGDTRVFDSRPVESDPGVIRRRRQCEGCGRRFYTWESTMNPLKHRASARARRERWRAKHPPEVKAEKRRASDLRYEAKRHAAETNQPVAKVMRAWNVPPPWPASANPLP